MARAQRRRPVFVVVGALVVVAVAAVATVLTLGNRPDPPPWGCGIAVREPLDPRSLQRVFPGAGEPTYSSAAPTSGPHAETQIRGVVAEPLPRPVQVGALENGTVVIQYRPDVSGPQVASLRRLVTPPTQLRAVVAPNADLDAPLVVTSWRTRMRCSRVDTRAIDAFASRAVPASSGSAP